MLSLGLGKTASFAFYFAVLKERLRTETEFLHRCMHTHRNKRCICERLPLYHQEVQHGHLTLNGPFHLIMCTVGLKDK